MVFVMLRIWPLVLFMTCGWQCLPSHAVIVDSQNNPVADNAIVIDGNRSDWNSIPFYPVDSSGDGNPKDLVGVQIAHDSDNVFFRLTFNIQSPPQFYNGNNRMYLDTDLNRGTGFFGSGGFLSLGADYLVEGTSVYSFTNGSNQGTWGWAFTGAGSYHDFPNEDVELRLPRSALGDPAGFDVIFSASSSISGAVEDYYPNSATGGAAGGAFRYSLAAVPEPSQVLLMTLVLVSTVIGQSVAIRNQRAIPRGTN